MRIELIKIKFDDTCSYKYRPIKYCCDALQKDKGIIFTNEDFVDPDEKYCDDDGNSIPSFCTTYTVNVNSYDDEWDEVNNYPIKFCPHCGERITTKVMNVSDLSKTYEALKKERKDLFIKANTTDSKKKESELKGKVRQLDNGLNWFFELNEWKE